MKFLPKIKMKHSQKNNNNNWKENIPTLPKINTMTTITTTGIKSETPRFLGLPKNRTGLFAADTIHEVKPTRNHFITVPTLSPQFRHNSSANLLLATSEQTHHQLQQYRLSNNEIQQYYPIDKIHGSMIDSSNDSRLTTNGVRNGFRPSTVRHQKLRLTTAVSQRNNHYYEMKDSSLKSAAVYQSHASAKLRSEIDHINNKLMKTKVLNKHLRLQNNSREFNDTPPSALSYSTSYRGSSASTHFTADRIHQRFSSAITHVTGNTRPTINNTSNQTPQAPSGPIALSPPLTIRETDEHEEEEEDEGEETSNSRPSHAYRIPQQSNVGSESIFLTDPSSISSIKTLSANYSRHSNNTKSVSCPFYVMYFTNLTMQQRQIKENNSNDKENDRTSITASSTVRKVPVNSRISTAYPKHHQLNKRQVNSPISLSTYSTLDDDDAAGGLTSSTFIPYNKRFSTKISPIENENSHLLRDILRTTSWNHVQV